MQQDFILLDRSGSMRENGKWEESLAAINDYVAKLFKDGVDTKVTLAVFDKEHGAIDYHVVRDGVAPNVWHPVVINDDVSPRGWTPLNDAIGRLVSAALAANADRTALIIVTDGQENASRELTPSQAKALLDQCRGKGWQVIFLGADFDNFIQAQSYGNAAAATMDVSVGNLRRSTVMMAAKRGLYGATGQSVSFSDDEKAQMKAKP